MGRAEQGVGSARRPRKPQPRRWRRGSQSLPGAHSPAHSSRKPLRALLVSHRQSADERWARTKLRPSTRRPIGSSPPPPHVASRSTNNEWGCLAAAPSLMHNATLYNKRSLPPPPHVITRVCNQADRSRSALRASRSSRIESSCALSSDGVCGGSTCQM